MNKFRLLLITKYSRNTMYNLFISSAIMLSVAISGTLTGTVNFEGKTKKRKPIPMDCDPVCGKSHKDTKALSESFIVDKDQNLKMLK